MGNKRAASPRAKSPPPRSTAGRKSDDRSPSPFQQAKKPASAVLQTIEKPVAKPAASGKKPASQSAFSGVQDPLFLILLVASFAVFVALELNETIVPVNSFATLRLEVAENASFLFIKHIVNKRLVPFISAILVMSGVLSIFFHVIKFFARPIVIILYVSFPLIGFIACASTAWADPTGYMSLGALAFLIATWITYTFLKDRIDRTAKALSNATEIMCEPVNLLQFLAFSVVTCTGLGLWVSHMYKFLTLKEIAGVLSGMLVSKQALYIFLHQYWLASTICGVTFMIAGRVAATRFLNRPTSVWHCMRDVILYGVGTASAFGLILAPVKLLDMLFRRAHSTNSFIWGFASRGMMFIPFELEAGIAFVVYYQYNNVRNGNFAAIFHYMVMVYAVAVVASLYAIQRTITWILEHIHKMTCYVAGIACCDFMTANKLTLEHFGTINSIGEYSHTSVTVKTFTSASFILLIVPTMRVADYVATLFYPCIGGNNESGSLFDRIIGRSDECRWTQPIQKFEHDSCYLSLAIGLLIFNHIMLRTLYDITLCTVMCSIMNGDRSLKIKATK